MEIRAANASGKLRSYVNQTEQANWTYNAIHFTLVERHFRSKNQARSHRGIREQLPTNFCAPQILLCPEKFVSNIK